MAGKRGIGFLFGCILTDQIDWGVRRDPKKFGVMVHIGPLLMSFAWEAWSTNWWAMPEHPGDPDFVPTDHVHRDDGGFTVFAYRPKAET